jgi:hypothetical protein
MRALAEIDRRFFRFLTDLLLCSRCLRRGVRTPVRQVISPHHRPRALCARCRAGLRDETLTPTRGLPREVEDSHCRK